MQETGAPTASPAATTPTGGDAGADGGATAGSLASGAGWTEHLSPDGRRYYHHKARGISSWEKPNELKTRAELSAAAAADSNWKEYTAASGKKYYFNTATRVTQWTMPAELLAVAEAKRALDTPATDPSPDTTPAPVAPAPASAPAAEAAAAAPDPAAAAASARFHSLLTSRGVALEDDWDTAMRKVVGHPDYSILSTLGEKKACFESWREAQRMVAEEAVRAEARLRKVEFLRLLRRPESGITSRTRYSSASERLSSAAEWRALDQNSDEREELYEEFCSSLARKEEGERRAAREAKLADARKLFLKEGVHSALCNEPELKSLDKLDRLAAFEAHIQGLEEEEAQAREASRASQRRLERKKRDAFRAAVAAVWEEIPAGGAALTPATVWKEAAPMLEKTDAYTECLDQPGSSPQDLFEDFIESKREEYKAHKQRLEEVLERSIPEGARPPPPHTVSADEFETAIRKADATGATASVPSRSVLFYHSEAVAAAARETAAMESSIRKAQRAAIETFQGALRGLMGATLTASTVWEDASSFIEGKPLASSLAESLQRKAFDELVAEMVAEEAEEAVAREAAGEEERKRQKRDRRERRRAEEGDEYRGEEGELDGRKRKREKKKRERRRGGEGSDEEGAL